MSYHGDCTCDRDAVFPERGCSLHDDTVPRIRMELQKVYGEQRFVPVAANPAPPPPATDPQAPTLDSLLSDHEDASMRFWREDGRGCAPLGGPMDPAAYALAEQTLFESKARIVDAVARLAAERDEWKRRAEEATDSKALAYRTIGRLKAERDEQRSRADTAESERDAARAEVARLKTGVLAGTPPLVVTYRNWRGEVRERRITPRAVWFGSTHWHPEAQWMLDATDEETGDLRTFAFAGFNPSKTSNSSDPRIEAWRGLDGEQRDIVLDLLRGAPQLWSYSGPTRSALRIAAAALESLAEPRP